MNDQLRSMYDRWSRLEETKTDIATDLKELFAEAKSNGYQPKALREAFRTASMSAADTAALDEHAVLVAMYLAGIVGTDDAPRAHPRVAREEPSLGETGDQRTRLAAAPPAGRGPSKAPATDPDDDDMAIPASLRRYA